MITKTQKHKNTKTQKRNCVFVFLCFERRRRVFLPGERGFGLVEVLVASAIISASLISLVAAGQIANRAVRESSERIQAQFLAEEGLETVRILRDESWLENLASLSSGTEYYPVFSTGTSVWSLALTDPGLIDGIFRRAIVFRDVYRRDSDDDIVASTSPEANTLDLGTREVISRVSWDASRVVEFRTYITDMFEN